LIGLHTRGAWSGNYALLDTGCRILAVDSRTL
jgi:hypothetical protein